MPTNPMVLTLTQYNTMRSQFQAHYFLSDCNTSFGGQDIQISWSTFNSAVQAFITSSRAAADTVALRFVLCYDTASACLYLRLQICTMTATGDPDTFNLDTTNCAWYKIQGTTMATTNVVTLEDQAYLDNFYYCDAVTCDPNTLVNLASDTDAVIFVRNLVFPWTQEVQQISADNGSPQGCTICFAAISYDAGNPSPAVAYPHSLAIYMRKHDGTVLLDDITHARTFQMKAGDMATACPPNCNVYIYPR